MFQKKFRVLSIDPNHTEFRLLHGGAIDESEMEETLLKLVWAVDPALNNGNGQLIPGAKADDVTTNISISEKDKDGFAHLNGINCAKKHAENLENIAIECGFEVTKFD